eukprot:1761525-Rhodomonas_salina.2
MESPARMQVFFASLLWLAGQQPLLSNDGSVITPAAVSDCEGSVSQEWGTWQCEETQELQLFLASVTHLLPLSLAGSPAMSSPPSRGPLGVDPPRNQTWAESVCQSQSSNSMEPP